LLTDVLEIHFIDVKKFNVLPDKEFNHEIHWISKNNDITDTEIG